MSNHPDPIPLAQQLEDCWQLIESMRHQLTKALARVADLQTEIGRMKDDAE